MGASGAVSARSIEGSIGFASDNVYRGLSLTAGRPTWLADLHGVLGSDWVAGLSASAERPLRQSAGAEFVAYVDRNWQLDGDWALQLGVAHHESRWIRPRQHYDDATLALGYRGRWRASVSLSPNVAGYYVGYQTRAARAVWFETGIEQPLVARLSLNVGVGHAGFSDPARSDYDYGSVGLRYGIDNAYVYLSYLRTAFSRAAFEAPAGPRSRWVSALVWTF
ncbi:MAG: hypothetical protein WBW61_08750 [Rhodanobacteraceae bacterium]